MDGKDYSVFSILPPFNNLHAQLVNATTGKAVTSGVTLTYEAVADPTGSINTSSADKTNFWLWVKDLYGTPLAADVGLTGNLTPSRTPNLMVPNTANGWFEATGLPITPYPDVAGAAKNYYPTVKVTAKDATGNVLATTTTVLPSWPDTATGSLSGPSAVYWPANTHTTSSAMTPVAITRFWMTTRRERCASRMA
jgi:hypothetical protein